MGIVKRIHHITLQTKCFNLISNYLVQSFGFKIIGRNQNKYVFRTGSATFVTKPLHPQSLEIDSVYDVALEVENVENVVRKAEQCGVYIISRPQIIKDSYGSVTIAKIRSCVGNVIHTILSTHSYHGSFLPQYHTNNEEPAGNSQVIKFDHITFAVPRGSSNDIISWYKDIFDMSRIQINDKDSVEEGFIIKHNNGGMRLKTFDYWKCSQVGINNDDNLCKFIIAEELNDKAPNQVGTFLREHHGPGIQHVALLVRDILEAARRSSLNGADFMIPPSKYYELMYKRLEVEDMNIPQCELEKYGILIDTEQYSEEEKQQVKNKFLLQAFTKPIFDRNTFFLELIERQGATGFGSGNIKALWEAVDATLQDSLSKEIKY